MMESGSTETGLAAMDSSKESGDNDLQVQGPRQPLRSFKGIVLQPTGRWGAQIYEGHERVWLGTFPDQETAARDYDVAALRYRGWEAVTNFPAERAHKGQQPLAFLAAHSKSEIVDMLRNHTYADELRQGIRRGVPAPPAWARVPLFEKTVTPSDVGKLNRLIVPRKHVERYLPPLSTTEKATGKGVVLAIEDSEGKVWRFRYSFWNSSQSYVLSKGWMRFVQEKGLRAGDTVSFSRWTFGPGERLLIDYRKKPEEEDAGMADAIAAVQAPVVKIFGVDIAVGGREAREEHMASS
ncbi:putative AP2/ERF and B3 domain-containing protein [Dichanthelium oligosanthes]|uniref:Putative AP2/ERF and B3 domain-containing protein n=1 Tax=Dichanthelium oligosanthes TaxID=888268 RepID=A0A1E5V530_9POAL|nr:putative AP2/ERF and B3 domain-containing protein [Dichanthelium oligosanthes]